MCGIIGVTSKTRKVSNDIVYGLKALEYRGYDSAGAIFPQHFEIYKTTQSLSTLEMMIEHQTTHAALGHTRWATHGKICIENTHPIRIDNAAMAHNGILENHVEVRKSIRRIDGPSPGGGVLQQTSYIPQTGTDTEILLALVLSLIKEHTHDGIMQAISEAKKIAHGSFAAAFVFSGNDTIYWMRHGIVPLIGAKYNDGSGYAIASDECAISQNAEVFELDNDSFGYITPEKIVCDKPTTSHPINLAHQYTKPANKSWLEIEIAQQADIYMRESESEPHLVDLRKYDSILLIGCGSAYLAATIGRLWLEESGIRAQVEIASEWNCRKSCESPNTLAIFISQSGETADTLLALEKAKNMGLPTLAIVNKENSTIAKKADNIILLDIGIEQSVASTKAFTTQLTKLFTLAKNEPVSGRLYDLAQHALNVDLTQLVNMLVDAPKIMIIGKNTMYSIAMEGALKLKELTYMNVDAYASSELKHGYIALVDEDTYAIGLLPSNECYQTALSNISETKTRNAKIILLAERNEIDADYFIKMPDMNSHEAAFIYVIILQRLALEIAHRKHLPIDRPRNLAKSITVV